MKLHLDIFPIKLEPYAPFKIARREEWVVENFLVRLSMGQLEAWGEAAPDPYYGDSLEMVYHDLQRLKDQVKLDLPQNQADLSTRWSELKQFLRTNAALNAVDTALWDITAKSKGLSSIEFLGYQPKQLLTSSTIGIGPLATMLAKLQKIKDHPIIKVKVGTPDDLYKLEMIREHYDGVLRVDANCGWQAKDLVSFSQKLLDLGVEFIEQPLSPDNDQMMIELKDEVAIPIIADESCTTEDRVQHCADKFHGVNIKLVKCGGMTPALRMLKSAKKLGLKVMVGGMLETNVCVAASRVIANGANYADLDGSWLLKEDPFEGHPLKNGVVGTNSLPGNGAQLIRPITEYLNDKFST